MMLHARTFWGAFIAVVGFLTGLTETVLSIYFHRPVIASVIFVSMVFAFVGGYIMYPKFTDGLARSFRENALPFVEVLRGGRRATDPVVEIPTVTPVEAKKDENAGLG